MSIRNLLRNGTVTHHFVTRPHASGSRRRHLLFRQHTRASGCRAGRRRRQRDATMRSRRPARLWLRQIQKLHARPRLQGHDGQAHARCRGQGGHRDGGAFQRYEAQCCPQRCGSGSRHAPMRSQRIDRLRVGKIQKLRARIWMEVSLHLPRAGFAHHAICVSPRARARGDLARDWRRRGTYL